MSLTNVFDICFQTKDKVYQAFSLRPHQTELFMHLCYSSSQRKFTDLDTQDVTQRPDHFSWHVDGNGHLKLGPDHRIQKGKFIDGSFLPSGKADLTPLFILSYIKGNQIWEAKPLEAIDPSSYLLNIGALEKFSIFCFLIPNNMPITAFQYLYGCFTPENKSPVEIALDDLFFTQINPIRLPVYPGYDILIFVSDLINLDEASMEKLQKQFEGEAYFSATFVDIDRALSNMLYQRMLANS